MKQKWIAAMLSLSLVSITGCGTFPYTMPPEYFGAVQEEAAEDTAGTEKSETGGGTPWIDSEFKGNVREDTPVDPKDDFHLYANKEWILENEIPTGYTSWSHYTERGLEVVKQCMELLQDESLTGHDAELVQTYDRLVLDWDARDAAGVTEIRDCYDRILAAQSVDDFTGLFTDSETYDELSPFICYETTPGYNNPERYLICISSPSLLLQDSAEYSERSELGDIYYGYYKELFRFLAGKMGMEEGEAAECFDTAIRLETRLSEKVYTTRETRMDDYFDRINNEMTLEETVSLAKVFPLKDILDAAGYLYDGPYLVERPDYFELLDEIYTDENLEEIRDYLLVKYLLGYSGKLDRETYDKCNELNSLYFGTSGTLSDEELAYNCVAAHLPASMQKVYISVYGSEEDKARMEDLCRQVIDTYRELLSENEWASDEVKDYAIEKLDKIRIHAAYPDKFRDTSMIDIAGCSLIEADKKIKRIEEEYERSLIGTEKDVEMWAEGFNILDCNAFYDFSSNTINMIIGMMGEPFYSSDMSTEELYASIGAFWVGHEISHAFDSNGSQFDAEGQYRNWWTDEDKAEFKRRVSKMDDYLDGIIAFGDYHFIGTNVDTEMVADMTGLQCALRMAAKVDGFDYDKFFTKYARMNASLSVYSNELSVLLQDEHPLDYSRTNVPVQQFEEFYETYHVQEGDNMYLAPEDRLLIW